MAQVTLTCPGCGHTLDGCLSASGSSLLKPYDGAIAVCMHCAAALRYFATHDGALGLRRLLIVEWAALDRESIENIGRATATVAQVHLRASYREAHGCEPQSLEQLLRWALFLENDS